MRHIWFIAIIISICPHESVLSKLRNQNDFGGQEMLDYSNNGTEHGQSKIGHPSNGLESKQPRTNRSTSVPADDYSNLDYHTTDYGHSKLASINVPASARIKHFKHAPERRQAKLDHYSTNVPKRYYPQKDYSTNVPKRYYPQLDYYTITNNICPHVWTTLPMFQKDYYTITNNICPHVWTTLPMFQNGIRRI